MNRFKSSNRYKGLTKINNFNLCVALCNQPNFISHYVTKFNSFILKYPFGSYNFGVA